MQESFQKKEGQHLYLKNEVLKSSVPTLGPFTDFFKNHHPIINNNNAQNSLDGIPLNQAAQNSQKFDQKKIASITESLIGKQERRNSCLTESNVELETNKWTKSNNLIFGQDPVLNKQK